MPKSETIILTAINLCAAIGAMLAFLGACDPVEHNVSTPEPPCLCVEQPKPECMDAFLNGAAMTAKIIYQNAYAEDAAREIKIAAGRYCLGQ